MRVHITKSQLSQSNYLTKSLLSRIRSNCSVISIEAVLKRWIRVFFVFQNVITVGFCVSRRYFCMALLGFVLHVHGGCTSTSEMLILEAGDGLRLSWTNSWPNRDAIHSRERNRGVSVALRMPKDASFANSFLRSVTTDFCRNFRFSEMSLIFAWREWCGNTHLTSSHPHFSFVCDGRGVQEVLCAVLLLLLLWGWWWRRKETFDQVCSLSADLSHRRSAYFYLL